jgi:VanZ family protein
MQKTSAWPLALIYAALIFYASLYPFSEWRSQGIVPWSFLRAPFPKYWTGFDVVINVLGYMPLGFLLVLSGLRTGKARYVVGLATLAAGLLSLTMESIQSYLPVRVPSSVDLVLNVVGAWLGAVLAWVMEKLGVIDRWGYIRTRWFVPEARGGLVLLALWPWALLFPAAVPFGLGQVLERIEAALAGVLIDSIFLDWLPVRDVELQPLLPGTVLVCVMLGVLIPCLLSYCIIHSIQRRVIFLLLIFALGVGATVLSAALSYGPEHALAWLNLPVKAGLVTALALVILLLWVPRRVSAALVLLSLGIYLSLLNQAPTSPYFAQTLATWEQGRFIRFQGLAQWLGWLWPYAALMYVLTQVGVAGQKTRIAP